MYICDYISNLLNVPRHKASTVDMFCIDICIDILECFWKYFSVQRVLIHIFSSYIHIDNDAFLYMSDVDYQ